MNKSVLFRLLGAMLLMMALVPLAPAMRFALPAEGTQIRDVRVEGLNRTPPGDITRVMELRAGRAFTAEAYRSDLQTITNTGRIDPMSLEIAWEQNEDGTIDIVVRAIENPVVSSIQLIGNIKYKRETLLSKLDYKEGDVAPTDLISRTERTIRRFYEEGGFKYTRITARSERTDEGEIDVIINIDEGQRIEIEKLIINGNKHFSSLMLKLRTTNHGGFLFFNNYYDELAFDEDMKTIRAMYERAGFLDVEVKRGEFIYDAEEGEVTPVIDVVEGPRYRVAGVRFQGVSYFNEEELKPLFRKTSRGYFNGKHLLRSLDRLKRLYGDQGYIDTEVDFSLLKNREEQNVTIKVMVRETPAIYVGEIRVVKGPDYDPEVDINAFERFLDWFVPPTKPETVRREVRLESGEKYRTSQEVRTQERLRRLGIFKTVNIRREPTGDPQVRDVEIEVAEDPNAAFVGASAGIGDRTGPSVTFELNNKNMYGEADRLRTSVTLGTRTTIYNIGYFNRRIGDSDTSAEVNFYRAREGFRAYRQRTYGSTLEFGRPLNDDWDGFLQFRVEHVDFSQYDRDAEEDFEGYWVFAVRPMVVRDTRDYAPWPTRGYKLSGGFETGYADGPLFKLLHGYEWYKTLGNSDFIYYYDHTVGLMPYDADRVGISERFFVGGTGSLRGFKYREVGPRDSGDDDLATGGSTRITQRHELRYPFNDFIRGRVFTDAAILEEGFAEFGRPRVGSGVGVIVDFGPFVLTLDFAVPVLKDDDDRAQFIHFNLSSDW